MKVTTSRICLITLLSLVWFECRNSNYPSEMKKNGVSFSAVRDIKLERRAESVVGLILALVVDNSQRILVADGLDGTIKVFTHDGIFLRRVEKLKPIIMTGLCVDEQDNIFVGDLRTNSVFVFSPEGVQIDSVGIDSGSRFILGIPRVWKDRLYVGLMEKKYSTMDFFKSATVGVFDRNTRRLVRRFGSFDQIYAEIIPLSPEFRFDIGENGKVYAVQSHSSDLFCYDLEGEPIGKYGAENPLFRKPTSPMPRGSPESIREWLTTWTYMNFVKASSNFVFTYYFDRTGPEDRDFAEDHYVDVYNLEGKVVVSGIKLPGRLLFVQGDTLYIENNSSSPAKSISLFSMSIARNQPSGGN